MRHHNSVAKILLHEGNTSCVAPTCRARPQGKPSCAAC